MWRKMPDDDRFEIDGDHWYMSALIKDDGGMVLWADDEAGNSCAFLTREDAERFAKWLQAALKTSTTPQAPDKEAACQTRDPSAGSHAATHTRPTAE